MPRPLFVERLNAGLHRKPTLISAPARFGKTTLPSQWVGGCGRPVAWVSPDKDDNDPALFGAYSSLVCRQCKQEWEKATLLGSAAEAFLDEGR